MVAMRATRMEIAWRRLLRDCIRLADEIEPRLRRPRRRRALRFFLYEMLVAARHYAGAVDALGPQRAFEAGPIERTLMETWIHTQWVLLRDPQRRAHRFIQYGAVAEVKALDKTPLDSQPPNFTQRRATAVRRRARVAHLFRGNGKWTRSWAKTPNIDQRALQVSRARVGFAADDEGRNLLYAMFSLLSEQGHVSQYGLRSLFSVHQGRIRPRARSDLRSVGPMASAACILLDIVGLAIDEFGVAYSVQHQRLADRRKRVRKRFGPF